MERVTIKPEQLARVVKEFDPATSFDVQLTEHGEINESVNIQVSAVEYRGKKLLLTTLIANDKLLKFFAMGRCRQVRLVLMNAKGNIVGCTGFTIHPSTYKPRLVKTNKLNSNKMNPAVMTFELNVQAVEYSI